MPDRPLLVFPTPAAASRSDLTGRGGRPAVPSRQRQQERLGDRLHTLATDLRASTLQPSLVGASAEKVLVFEVAGSVDSFADAATKLARRVAGLEWLAEWADEDREPDDDFHFLKKTGERKSKLVQTKLYLLSSNLRGLESLESLWRQWQASSTGNLPTGLAPFRDLFSQLADVRFWSAADRVEETGILASWREDAEHFPDQPVRCEVEFWYRNNVAARQRAEATVTAAVVASGGRIVSRCDLAHIRYHAQLVELPRRAAEAFVRDVESLAVVRCDEVMYLRPVGQSVRLHGEDEGPDVAPRPTQQPAQVGPAATAAVQPRIGILDGLPIEQHNLLAGCLVVDNPDDVDYAVEHRRHGTAMASLVVNGDATSPVPLLEPVYLRPVLASDERSLEPEEALPRDRLVPDFIHECIVRMCGDQNTAGTAPRVRIVNMSLGDRSQLFLRTMSPWARLLDWLSWNYDLLFVVSAGNHKAPLSIEVDERTLLATPAASRRSYVLDAIAANRRLRTLLAPAETVNGLAVGAANVDPMASGPFPGHVDLFDGAPLPSVVSANGLGFRRSVKPDLLMPGGRLGFRFFTANAPLSLQLPRTGHGPHHAAPPRRAGQFGATSRGCGTSHAAALATRAAAQSLAVLDDLRTQPAAAIPDGYEALFAKAVLVHGAMWGESGAPVEAAVRRNNTGRHQSDLVARFLGYGLSDVEWALSCTQRRAVVLGFGTLSDGQAHRYELPIPSQLFTGTVRRRLVTTLAWFSPIRPTNRKYRAADLWADLKPAELGVTSVDVDDKTAGRGTVEHHVYEGARAVVQPRPSLTIQVNCREDAAPLRETVKYVLMVTLEALEAVPIDVYVTTQLAIREAIRVQERERIGRLA